MANKKAPELRFKGFTDDWELCTLGGSTIKIGSGKTPKGGNATYLTSGIPLLRSQNIYNDMVNLDDVVYISEVTNEEMLNSQVLQDDILLNITGASIGRSAVYGEKIAANVNQHVCIIRLKTGLNAFFVHSYLVSEMGQKQIEMNQAGGGREGLNFKQISNFEFFYPSIAEQNKIANLFEILNTSITLHQQKIDELVQLKQGFLQQMFPVQKKNVPRLRFANFNSGWDQYKLGDHSQILTGGTPKTQVKEYWEPKEIPWMSSGEINKKRLSTTNNQISKLGFESSSARWVKENSVLIALAGQGKTRGTVAINEIQLTTNQSIAAIEPNDNLYFEFLFQNLDKRYEELRSASSGDGSRGGLNKQIISSIKIIAPSIKEQIKVGLFFKHLDETTALHQQKVDSLNKIKRTFLQKMFM